MTQTSSGEKYVNNLLLDTSAEKSTSQWTASDSTATFAIDTSNYFLGYKSLKVARTTSNTANHGYYQSATVTAGQTYTLSAYLKTNSVTASGTYGAGLYATFYNSSGTALSTVKANGLTGTNDWQRVKLTFTAPTGAATVRVHCGLMSATGTAYFDCIQLETGNAMNDYNMIESSSFERFGSWTGQSMGTGDGTNTTNGYFRLTGSATASNRSGFQTVQVNRQHTSFTISAKATGQSVPTGYDGRYYAIDLGVYYSDGTSTWHVKSFNTDTAEQQRTTLTVTIPESKQDLTIKYVVYYLIYYNNANTVYFDDCMMTFDETGTSYTYDSDGNMLTARDNDSHKTTMTYDSDGNLTNVTDENGSGTNLTYDSNNQITSVESTDLNNGSSVTYDSYGNALISMSGVLGDDDQVLTSQAYIQTSNAYNSTGNYLTSATDERGYTTTYTVDATTGLTTAVTDALDNTVNYSYDSNSQNLLSISSGDSSVSFTYGAANRLSSILHNGFNYNMTYDAFGNLSSVKVGEQALVSYSYGSNNGYLSSMTYGNGDVYGYTCDDYGRVTAISVNEIVRYTAVYDAKENVATVTDAYTGYSTDYTYDHSGNLIRAQQPGYSDIRMYSQSDLQSQTVYSFGGQSKTFTLTQDSDGLNSTATLISGLTAQKTYDTLNRETAYAKTFKAFGQGLWRYIGGMVSSLIIGKL